MSYLITSVLPGAMSFEQSPVVGATGNYFLCPTHMSHFCVLKMRFATDNDPAQTMRRCSVPQHFKSITPLCRRRRRRERTIRVYFAQWPVSWGRSLLTMLQLTKLYAHSPNVSVVRVRRVRSVRNTFHLASGQHWEKTAIFVCANRCLCVILALFAPYHLHF